MEFPLFWVVVSCAISMSFTFPSAVNSKPLKFDFSHCHRAVLENITFHRVCCPLKPTKPIIDGVPPPLSTEIRVRKALQCTDEDYGVKLKRAYALMRALPNDDPRSLRQQAEIHCGYCGGSMRDVESHSMIDVHKSWFFLPYHRWFLYFHERILQSLLEDPTFTLSYWNWDSPYTVGDGSSETGACLKQGHDFPAFYNDPLGATYDANRSERAKGTGRFRFPDLTFLSEPETLQNLFKASEQVVIRSNLQVMHHTMMRGGTTAETFMGRRYRRGDGEAISDTTPVPFGILEGGPHAAVHYWTGLDSPAFADMGSVAGSGQDPIFYSHHGNVDRLWEVWKSMGYKDYSDPDFLNAEFLLYDENKDLRRVKVADGLNTTKLGYVYQHANDAAWMYLQQTRCSQLTKHKLIARAQTLPSPTQDSEGCYHLQYGTPFIILVDRPDNPHGLEEFLTIDGIKLESTSNAGFDVFVNFLNPGDYKSPWRCAEYSGRFMHMAENHLSINEKQNLGWKQSITGTLVDIHALPSPYKLVVTLVPLSPQSDDEIIKFTSIKINT
ncbi:unnamed protein product [Calypogeia fissa]